MKRCKTKENTSENKTEQTGWISPDSMKHTHLFTFEGKGDFKPRTPMELLNKLNSASLAPIVTGYFRTWQNEGKLVGAICTNDEEALRKKFESVPELILLKVERLDAELFSKHIVKKQESLSLPSKNLQKVQQSDWYKLLNKPQKNYVALDENMFASVYASKNYEVGDKRDELEAKWIKLLEGKEPGYPAGGKVHPYDEAIIGLATIKSEKAMPLLIKIAAERVIKDNAHRHYATKALGIFGDKAAIPELIPLVYHYNFNTRWEAQIALVRLTGQNFGRDAEAWGKWYNENREKLGKSLPAFDATPVDWIFGSSDMERKGYNDSKVQIEYDEKLLGKNDDSDK